MIHLKRHVKALSCMLYVFFFRKKPNTCNKYENIGELFMSKRVYRLDPKTKTEQYPYIENGFYVLGDPAFGKKKHLKKNQVTVKTERKMIELIIHKGFSVRVNTAAARPSLVRLNIYIDGKKVS